VDTDMTGFHQSEYEALRATIRERGTARIWVVLGGLAAWGSLAILTGVTNVHESVSFVPLLVLVAAYEINFFIHTGVERIGRYIQVFYEEPARASSGWETTAMKYGAKYPGGLDPLFTLVFYSAAALDFFTSFRGLWWSVVSLIAHAAFVYRVFSTKRLAATQRAADLERFHSLRN
jgi:hypothetical protein